MPLFGKMIREHFVERAELEHTCWTSKTVTTTEASKKSENKGCAVLIPLVNIRDQPCMLFTQRALSLKNYSGAVCFPGGKLEADENPEQGALRESYEEIGLDMNKVDIWGKLDPVYNGDLNCRVTPVVGMLENVDLKKLKAQYSEVRTVFVVTVDELCSNKSYTRLKKGCF
ncbi:unnamed protein product [Enterobius vermicularis]|uniref:Nudix hydrolase domain-containing protein n=1 Tax=Enterobius vermicularis TaxID=51028 RepID=A0A0N4UUX7_ENTVE|nr:unnamed protein product [Enterobius vermicularis]